jgi:hypothetical protein
MSRLENPKIEIKIHGSTTITITDLFMDYDIDKDTDEEPNEAELTIYNLSEDLRSFLKSGEFVETPLEIYLTKAGGSELVRAFAGEINTARSSFVRPGHETRIHCLGQKFAHYSAYIDQLTFPAGTPAPTIIATLADAIGLPQLFGVLPVVPIMLSQSFTGNAFKQLSKFCADYGLRVFVLDGVLRISDIYTPPNLVPKVILPSALLSSPIPAMYTDEELVEKMSMSEATLFNVSASANRKKTKQSKKSGPTDYVEYDAVDKQVDGWDFEFLCQPDIDPDDIITVVSTETAGKLLRVREVSHSGNNENFDIWNTEVKTSVYEAF